jgi:hypothetical protein
VAYGAFFFAWVDPEEFTFGVEHHREDMQIIQFSLQHRENDFATLSVVVRNVMAGLLNPGRKQHAWFAFDFGGATGVQPLFFGRVIGVPDGIAQTRQQFTFRARPDDYKDLKADLAETLKVAPYWDPVWIDAGSLDDPDVVLQARTQSWHVDRITHEMTVSDNILGEDGTLEFDGDAILNGSVNVTYSGPAVSSVRVKATIRYTQSAVGTVDISPNLIEAFRLVGTEQPFMISSYTGDGLVNSWPLPGENIGGGWSVADSDIDDGQNRWVSLENKIANRIAAWASTYWSASIGASMGSQVAAQFDLWVMKPLLVAGYEARRSRTELIDFTLRADVQAMLTDPGDDDAITIQLSSNEVSEPIDTGDTDGPEIPLDDMRRRSYIITDRGQRSLEYLIARARAELLDHARVASVSFSCRFDNILDLSCRKDAVVNDPMIPGGQAVGKIIGYSASGDGETGQFTCSIEIGCTVGQGGAVTATAGTPTHVEEGHYEPDYQMYEGNSILLAPGDVTYDEYRDIEQNDDGINFFNVHPLDVLESIIVTNGPAQQRTVMDTHYEDIPSATEAMKALFTQICVRLKPVQGGPYDNMVPVTLSDLVVPKQIDLEAPAV